MTIDELSDEQLMLNYRDGNTSAFDQLYARHKAALYRYVLRHSNNQADVANELYQEIWLKLIKSREHYRHTAKFTTYLYRIAHNHVIDYWRSRKNKFAELSDHLTDCDEHNLPENALSRQQLAEQIKQQITALPQEQRDALLLKEEAALSLEQIAEVTGVNRETVKSRLRYAVSKLKQSLAPIS